MIDHDDAEGPPSSVTPFQYSLLSMLVITAAFAVVCSGLFAASEFSAFVTTLFGVVSLPAVLTIIVIYGEGRLRAFGIGALFPAGASLAYATPIVLGTMIRFGSAPMGNIRQNLVYFLLTDFTATAAIGLLAVWTRWLIEESRKRRQREASSAQESPLAAPTE